MENKAAEIKLQVQKAIDRLFKTRQIPFELIAYSVASNDREHVVRFNDSRIHSFHFYWQEGEDLEAAVQAALLDRVNDISGPLRGKRLTAGS